MGMARKDADGVRVATVHVKLQTPLLVCALPTIDPTPNSKTTRTPLAGVSLGTRGRVITRDCESCVLASGGLAKEFMNNASRLAGIMNISQSIGAANQPMAGCSVSKRIPQEQLEVRRIYI
jgi:hypothetical protein